MGMVIAIANQKGGVGKTTSCVNIPAAMAAKHKKILVVDADPQGNTSSGFGVVKNEIETSVYDLITDSGLSTEQAIINVRDNLDMIPANIDLAGAEIELVNKENREYKLRASIDKIKPMYDYIFIDCPPSLGLLTINALVASDAVLVPVQAEYYALEGLMQLFTTLEIVKKNYHPLLKLAGVFITMYDQRTQLSHDVENEVRWYFGDNYYDTVIARNVRLSEAPSHSKTIFEYDRSSRGARNYMKLAKEMLHRFESNAWKSGKLGNI